MVSQARKTLATQVDSEILAAVHDLAQSEGRELQSLVDEALADLIEKRHRVAPRPDVMAAYQSSHAQFSSLYKKLAE